MVAVPAVDEPMANAVEAACEAKVPPTNTESDAYGEVVPIPTLPVTPRLVPVALPKAVLPARVVEAAKRPPVAFNSEEMVVEPVTANDVEVAPWRLVAPETVSDDNVVAPAVTVPKVAPPVALNWPVTVVEPVTASAVEVAPCVERRWSVVRPATVSVVFDLMLFASRLPFTVVEPVMAREVPVALPKNVFPTSVVEAAKRPPVAFNREEMVVDPVTAKLVDVAPLSDVPPSTVSAALRLVAPPTFKLEEMVVEPVIAKLVVVPFVPKKLPRVEDAE